MVDTTVKDPGSIVCRDYAVYTLCVPTLNLGTYKMGADPLVLHCGRHILARSLFMSTVRSAVRTYALLLRTASSLPNANASRGSSGHRSEARTAPPAAAALWGGRSVAR